MDGKGNDSCMDGKGNREKDQNQKELRYVITTPKAQKNLGWDTLYKSVGHRQRHVVVFECYNAQTPPSSPFFGIIRLPLLPVATSTFF